jgi:hypothetical protein
MSVTYAVTYAQQRNTLRCSISSICGTGAVVAGLLLAWCMLDGKCACLLAVHVQFVLWS